MRSKCTYAACAGLHGADSGSALFVLATISVPHVRQNHARVKPTMARDTFDTRSGLHRVLAFFDVTGGGLGTNIGAGIYALIAAAAATRAASARPPVSTSVGSICTRNQGDSPKRIPEGPKVIGIRQRNAPSDAIATLLRHSEADIAGFMAHPEAARLPLGRLTSDA